MNYLNGRKVELLVVPVRCESEQGTAFFISKYPYIPGETEHRKAEVI